MFEKIFNWLKTVVQFLQVITHYRVMIPNDPEQPNMTYLYELVCNKKIHNPEFRTLLILHFLAARHPDYRLPPLQIATLAALRKVSTRTIESHLSRLQHLGLIAVTPLGDSARDLVILGEKLFMPSVHVLKHVVVNSNNSNHELNNMNSTDKQQQHEQHVTPEEFFELQKQLAEVLVLDGKKSPQIENFSLGDNERDIQIIAAKIFVLTGHEHAVVNKTMFKSHEESLITSTTNYLIKQQHVQHATADKVVALKNELAGIFILGGEEANKALRFVSKFPLIQFFTLPSHELVITAFSGKLFNSPEHVKHVEHVVVNKHDDTCISHESSNNNSLKQQHVQHVTETELEEIQIQLAEAERELVILCEKIFMPSVLELVVVTKEITSSFNDSINNYNLLKEQQHLVLAIPAEEIFDLQRHLAKRFSQDSRSAKKALKYIDVGTRQGGLTSPKRIAYSPPWHAPETPPNPGLSRQKRAFEPVIHSTSSGQVSERSREIPNTKPNPIRGGQMRHTLSSIRQALRKVKPLFDPHLAGSRCPRRNEVIVLV